MSECRHNPIPIGRRLWRDLFRLSYWSVCIRCDEWRRHEDREAQLSYVCRTPCFEEKP